MKTIEKYVEFEQLTRICFLLTGALLLLATIAISVPELTYAQTLVPPSINLRQAVKPIVPPTRGAVEKLEDRIIAADYRLRALDASVLRTPPSGRPGIGVSSMKAMAQELRQPPNGRDIGPPAEPMPAEESRVPPSGRSVGTGNHSGSIQGNQKPIVPTISTTKPSCLPPAIMLRPPGGYNSSN